MIRVSFALMCHPKREEFVPGLLEQLPDAEVVWDQKNNRWDTGRRSMLAYDPDADWHVVVQDDAILCPGFREAAHNALACCPAGPVSFYTGKTRPYAEQVKRAVREAISRDYRWIAMRGPLWGPAVAIPVSLIDNMVEACDDIHVANYDIRMSEYFHNNGYQCWYSIPSLVNHRVGRDNPSLVPGRSSVKSRTAYEFVGNRGDTDAPGIDWDTPAWFPVDPSEPWKYQDGYLACTGCSKRFPGLSEAISHVTSEHGTPAWDFMAGTPGSIRHMVDLAGSIPEEYRGTLWVAGIEMADYVPDDCPLPVRVERKQSLRRTLAGQASVFTLVPNAHYLKHLTGRPGWAIAEGVGN